VVEDIEKAIKWIKSYQKNPKAVKDMKVFDAAIKKFKQRLSKIYRNYKSQGW
jgi:hypothetical protein